MTRTRKGFFLSVMIGALACTNAWAISGSYYANGTPVDTRIDPIDARGQFWPSLGGTLQLIGDTHSCSATALSSTVLVSAAHCASAATSAVYSVWRDTPTGDQRETAALAVAQFVSYPGYDTANGAVQPNDIAVVKLAQPLPYYVPTYGVGLFPSTQYTRQVAIFAGYGIAMNGNDTSYASSLRSDTYFNQVLGRYYYVPQLRSGMNEIDAYSSNGTVFTTDFDAPGGDGLGAMEAGTTQGDSGSGVFFNADTSEFVLCLKNPSSPACNGSIVSKIRPAPQNIVIGVTSFSSSYGCAKNDYACMNRFGTKDGYTALGPYASWLNDMMGGELSVFSVGNVNTALGSAGLFKLSAQEFDPLEPAPAAPFVAVIPEPGSCVLSLVGLGVVAARLRGRRAA